MNSENTIGKLKYDKSFVQSLSDKLKKDASNNSNHPDEVFALLMNHLSQHNEDEQHPIIDIMG